MLLNALKKVDPKTPALIYNDDVISYGELIKDAETYQEKNLWSPNIIKYL